MVYAATLKEVLQGEKGSPDEKLIYRAQLTIFDPDLGKNVSVALWEKQAEALVSAGIKRADDVFMIGTLKLGSYLGKTGKEVSDNKIADLKKIMFRRGSEFGPDGPASIQSDWVEVEIPENDGMDTVADFKKKHPAKV